ncbi:type II secretion system F family protein [Criibacterium bergeronii]|uniref:type II secretion system F family protein n=1 Tax=Criibacterium bergeronii TaxID=1871336 RepID=UPI000828531E|nr:type II secretion system F family protein [Criibacterium bergeronii]MBS6064028.1 type II secretion system F family protein [Peptostreptococcaceae bacterium]
MKKFQSIFKPKEKKLSFYEQYEFFDSLSKIARTSFNLVDSLDLILQNDKKFVTGIKNDISGGKSMCEALQNTNKFSQTSYAVVTVGEETGRLDIAFERLADYFKIADETKNKVKKAFAYPSVLILAIFALICYINFSFIPSVATMYQGSDVQLPAITHILMGVSAFTTKYFLQATVLFITLVFIIFLLVNLRLENKNLQDINLPIISDLANSYSYAYVLWTYYLLISSGIDILRATDLLIEQIKSKSIKLKLNKFYGSVKEGNSIKEAIDNLDLKQNKISYFLDIGEKTGTMEESLKMLSDIYFKELTDKISKITKLLEPALVFIIAVTIGFVVIFVILPLISANFSSIQ